MPAVIPARISDQPSPLRLQIGSLLLHDRPRVVPGWGRAGRETDDIESRFQLEVIYTSRLLEVDRTAGLLLLKDQSQGGEHGFITVKTAKTGQKVDNPIFPLLKEELERSRKGKSPYCFPKQAEMYANNPDGITWRVKQVLAKALRRAHDPKALPEVSPEEVRCRGLEYLDGLRRGTAPRGSRCPAWASRRR